MTSWNNRTWAEFRRSHRHHLISLKVHIKGGRCKKSIREKNVLLRELWKSDAPFLEANNIYARIDFAEIWLRLGREFGDGKPCYLVTLAPEQFALSFDEVPSFDLRKLHSLARQTLLGFDFIGNAEIGCYTNFRKGLHRGPLNSLHVHAMVVDPDVKLLKKRVRDFSGRFQSLVPGCPSAHAVRINPVDIDCILLYMVKAAAFEYRVAPRKTEVVDPTTGEVLKKATGRYSQYKGEAKRHIQLSVRKAVSDWYLDKLIFAGGYGKGILQQVRKDSLKSLPRKMRSKRQHEFSGAFKPPEDDL